MNYISVIIASSEFEARSISWGEPLILTMTLNVRTVNVILILLWVFFTNPVTKRCRRCRAMNIPVRTKQKKKTCWQNKKRAES